MKKDFPEREGRGGNERGEIRNESTKEEEPNIGTVFISLCGRLQRDDQDQ